MTDTGKLTPKSVILIIDDTRENRMLLSSQLKLEGYAILEAGGGEEGIEMAQAHDPDVILLDVMMPDIDGFEVCRQLKAEPQTQLIPIIMVTALNRVESRIEGKRAGADEFLSRPHVREELLVRVRTYIQLKRTRVSLEEERNRLQLLYNSSRTISTKLNLDEIMADIIILTQSAVNATKGNIMLLDQENQVNHRFLIRAGESVQISDSVTQAVMTRGLGGWLLKNQRSEIIDDITQDKRWITLPDDRNEHGSAVGVPLIGPERIEGILILNHPDIGYFTKDHKELLETIAGIATSAIINARLFSEVNEERRKLETILTRSTDAIIITDELWHVSLFNHAAERLFDLNSTAVVNHSIVEVPQLNALHSLIAHSPNSPETREISLANGRTLYASSSPIQGVGFALVLQDITELKRAEWLRLEAERREKERVKNTFSRYMGPRLVNHVLENAPELMARRERRNAVVMFADLRNWTGGMITRVEPDEAIEQLNEFFTRMMNIAIEYDGTIFELTADEILAGFNAPFDQPDAAERAVRTAVTMQQEFNSLRQKWYKQAGTELGLGIGIDTGEIVIGNVGAESRMSFRMVGQPMNTASRLVDMAEDGQIVVSNAVYTKLKTVHPQVIQEIHFTATAPITLKGISQPQILYRAQILRSPLY